MCRAPLSTYLKASARPGFARGRQRLGPADHGSARAQTPSLTLRPLPRRTLAQFKNQKSVSVLNRTSYILNLSINASSATKGANKKAHLMYIYMSHKSLSDLRRIMSMNLACPFSYLLVRNCDNINPLTFALSPPTKRGHPRTCYLIKTTHGLAELP